MTDLDTTIKTLINSAVDAELGGHRAAPPMDRAALADRPGPAHALRQWGVPLLAASVVALLAAGATLAITLKRDQLSGPVRNPAGPSPSPSLSRSAYPDLESAQREYSEAVATAVEATEADGVTVGPLSARDAARLKGHGMFTGDVSSITAPTPGKTYSFTLSYLAGPSDDPPGVLTSEVRDVASGSCAPPFLARPGHAYVVHCQAMLLAGVTGKGTLTLRTPTGMSSGSINLTDPAKYPASPSASIDPDQELAAREYSEAVANAPEASTVAGVVDRPATAEQLKGGEGVGSLNTLVVAPDRDRSYPVTLIYTPASDGPAIAVLAIRFEDVTVGGCPSAFRARPGRSYLIHCQATFRSGAVGKAYYTLIGPHGTRTIGKTVSTP